HLCGLLTLLSSFSFSRLPKIKMEKNFLEFLTTITDAFINPLGTSVALMQHSLNSSSLIIDVAQIKNLASFAYVRISFLKRHRYFI
ncbi:MAG: hypothetical protein AAGK05_19700, partial [Pseudomonadota bacterium]